MRLRFTGEFLSAGPVRGLSGLCSTRRLTLGSALGRGLKTSALWIIESLRVLLRVAVVLLELVVVPGRAGVEMDGGRNSLGG